MVATIVGRGIETCLRDTPSSGYTLKSHGYRKGVINSDSDNAGIYSLTWKDGCVFFLAGVLHTLCGLLRCFSGKESACSAGHVGNGSFHPWVGKIPWRRKWQPTPIFLPEKSHGQRSLVGYSPWGRKCWTQTSMHAQHRLCRI